MAEVQVVIVFTCFPPNKGAERPIISLGHPLVYSMLMLLIFDLQTLCFLFSASSLDYFPHPVLS